MPAPRWVELALGVVVSGVLGAVALVGAFVLTLALVHGFGRGGGTRGGSAGLTLSPAEGRLEPPGSPARPPIVVR